MAPNVGPAGRPPAARPAKVTAGPGRDGTGGVAEGRAGHAADGPPGVGAMVWNGRRCLDWTND